MFCVYHCLGGCVCVLVAQSRPTLCNPWTVACQAPLSMEYSRQECWNGLPLPSPTVSNFAHYKMWYRYTVDLWPTQGLIHLWFIVGPCTCSSSASNNSTNTEAASIVVFYYWNIPASKWKWTIQTHVVQGSTVVLLDHKTVDTSYACYLILKECGLTL